ncbi:MAG: PAS domain S-box protein [Tychonema bourrellyi B0820]|uniref:Histidine kinase n=1 Tax=Tychonema bourrellyi FEM_GT703 TaxID=2040638 RepID=A0A2G4F5B1_9CYAN|nr:PAS domain S-box protein [Tychonema bourrellyi]MDQ2100623.1 PAS domain S-box protein [Tychonema bourrellyi B0820]PHX56936.1 histidine kinase [Tychonema bourrellyi FEM_GT703]
MSYYNQSIYKCREIEREYNATSLQLIVAQLRAELNSTREQLHREIDRLTTANETLQAAIRAAPMLLWATDREGKVTLAEGKGLESLGLLSGEVVGNSIFEIYSNYPDVLENFTQVLAGSSRSWNTLQGDLTYEIRSTPMRSSKGEVVGLVSVFTEISDRDRLPVALQIANQELECQLQQQTEVFKTALTESERKYQNLVETSQELIWSVDLEGSLTFVNSAAERIYGYEPPEMIGHRFTDFLLPEHKPLQIQIFEQLLAPNSIQQAVANYAYETVHIRKDGSHVYLRVNSIVNKAENGTILGLTGTATDISDRKRAEAHQTKLISSLQTSEHKFRSLYEATSDAVMLLNEKEFFDCNSATLKIFGCTNKKEFYGKHPREFSPLFQPSGEDSASLSSQQINIAIATGSCRFDWVHKRLDGSEFPAEVLLNVMEINGQKFLQAVVRDITDRKRDEDQIKASLAEKEVLLQEIHHRVKNNLQVISSLLKLQSRYIQDNRVIEMLKESQNRVRSMALVHEQLYQSKDLSNINFAEYIENLAHNLFQAYEVNAAGIKLETNIARCDLNVDTAVPCGLIINELVTNSLKYAFSEKNEGKIKIDFNLDRNGVCVLVVSDTGVGFPKDLDYRNARTLGLRLVGALARQIRGSITLVESVGTVFRITFSQPKLQQERQIYVN